MPKSTLKEPNEKMFSMKAIETNVIANINQRHNAELVDFLSFVAIERLAYDVTVNTKFRVDGEGNLFISENEPEAEEDGVAVA